MLRASHIVTIRDIVLGLFIFLCTSFALAEALDWPTRSRIFPLAVGVPLLFLVTSYLARRIVALRRTGAAEGNDPSAKEQDAWLVDAVKGLRFGAWLIAYAIGSWLLGFAAAAGITTVLFLRLDARESWKASVIMGSALLTLMIVLSELVGLRLHAGLVNW